MTFLRMKRRMLCLYVKIIVLCVCVCVWVFVGVCVCEHFVLLAWQIMSDCGCLCFGCVVCVCVWLYEFRVGLYGCLCDFIWFVYDCLALLSWMVVFAVELCVIVLWSHVNAQHYTLCSFDISLYCLHIVILCWYLVYIIRFLRFFFPQRLTIECCVLFVLGFLLSLSDTCFLFRCWYVQLFSLFLSLWSF